MIVDKSITFYKYQWLTLYEFIMYQRQIYYFKIKIVLV